MVYACEEALRLIDDYEPAGPAASSRRAPGSVTVYRGAPGALYHRYELDDGGHDLRARIVPPTSQNQAIDRGGPATFADRLAGRAELTGCEQAVRNYDPCISCATHFLRVTVERG